MNAQTENRFALCFAEDKGVKGKIGNWGASREWPYAQCESQQRRHVSRTQPTAGEWLRKTGMPCGNGPGKMRTSPFHLAEHLGDRAPPLPRLVFHRKNPCRRF